MYRNTNNNKKNKNKKQVRNFGTTIPNAPYTPAFPRQMEVTLKYASNLTIVTTTGLAYDHQYNLNSIFDPDRTGTGHLPLAYNQWSAFYSRYRVDGARVRVSWLNSSSLGQMCSIVGSNNTPSLTSPELAIENPLSLSRGMAQNQPAVILTRYYNLANVAGVTRIVYNADDRFQAPFGSSPTELLIMHVVTDTPTSVTLYINVQIEYFCTLSDAIQITGS